MKHKTGAFIKSQRGVALLFALGIVGMMAALAIAFSSISLTDKDVASNASAQLAAKYLAESTVHRVASLLNYSPSTIDSKYLVSGGDTGTNANHYDFLWRMRITDPDIANSSTVTTPEGKSRLYEELNSKLVTDFSIANSNSKRVTPLWQYVYDQTSTSSSDPKPILGRFAYATIRTTGLLDALAPISQDEGADSTIDKRFGITTKELDLRPLTQELLPKLRSSIFKPTDPTQNRYDNNLTNAMLQAIGPVEYNKPAFYTSPLDFLTQLDAAYLTNMNQITQSKLLRDWFRFPRGNPTRETFWYDNGGVKEYYKFNLNRSPNSDGKKGWDTLSVATLLDINNLSEYTAKTSTQTIEQWEEQEKEKALRGTQCIPWIANSNWTPTQKNQVAANIIGYFDSTAISIDPTTRGLWDKKLVAGDNAANAPTYTGNFKCPQLNEALLRLSINFKRSPAVIDTTTNEYLYTITLTAELEIETADPYNTGIEKASFIFPDDQKPSIKVTIPSNYSSSEVTLTFENSYSAVGAAEKKTVDDIIYRRYKISTSAATYSVRSTSESSSINVVTNTVKTNLGGIELLTEDGKYLDYATVRGTPNNTSTSSVSVDLSVPDTLLSKTAYYTIDHEVVDFRYNLDAAQWTTSREVPLTIGTISTGNSLEAANSNVPTTSTDKDPETSYSKRLSTDYMRASSTAPYAESLWEIGAINRGAAYQTINLKKAQTDCYKYDSANRIFYFQSGNAGAAGSYDKGDANLLDQLKINPTPNATVTTATGVYEQYGKIDVNAVTGNYPSNKTISSAADCQDLEFGNLAAFASLFYGIHLTGNLSSCNDAAVTMNSGTAISLPEIKSIVGQFAYWNDTPSNLGNESGKYYNFKTPAEILRATAFQDAFKNSKTTDSAQEELIGKTIQLMTASEQIPKLAANTLIVVVIAQTIKDNLVNNPPPIDWNNSGSVSDSPSTNAAWKKAGYMTDDGTMVTASPAPTVSATFSGTARGTYQVGFDKILATQKIVAFLRKDQNTGKWKVVRMDYVD